MFKVASILFFSIISFYTAAKTPAVKTAAPVIVETQTPAVALLQGISKAYKTQNYQGRFVFLSGEKMHSLEILHGFSAGVAYERLKQLDGAGAQIIRRGDLIICQLAGGEARINTAAVPADFIPPFANTPENIERYYEVDIAGVDRVAGREAIALTLRPHDAHRLAYRLWVDKEKGLLLRSYTFDNTGNKRLDTFEFVSLKILPEVLVSWFDPNPNLPTHRIHPKAMQEKAMAMPMFASAWLPEGFMLSEVKHWQAEHGRAESQMYSDGVAVFSAFIEPLISTSDVSGVGGITRNGATVAVDGVLEQGDKKWLLTVVGEIPAATARKIVQNLVHK